MIKNTRLKTILTLLIFIVNLVAHRYLYSYLVGNVHGHDVHIADILTFAYTTFIAGILIFLINFDIVILYSKKIKPHLRLTLKYFLIGLVLIFGIFLVTTSINGPVEFLSQSAEEMAGGFAIFSLLGGLIGLPFVEELTYKVGIFNVVDRLKLPHPYIVSAVLFGLLHICFAIIDINLVIPSIITNTLLGLKFGYLYAKTHHIFTSVFVGIAFDVIFFFFLSH